MSSSPDKEQNGSEKKVSSQTHRVMRAAHTKKTPDVRRTIPRLNQYAQGSHIVILGGGGTLMGTLAGMLLEIGYRVTVFDKSPIYEPMKTVLKDYINAGLPLTVHSEHPYSTDTLKVQPDLVIMGNALSAKDDSMGDAYVMTELQKQAVNSDADGIPYSSAPEIIGQLIEGLDTYAAVGTNGKTTTATMMASVLRDIFAEKAGWLFGGKPINLTKAYNFSENTEKFVIEGDEYDDAFWSKSAKFLSYKPKNVIWTNMVHDHVDLYPSFEDYKAPFRKLLEQMPENGLMVANFDDEEIRNLLTRYSKPLATFGIQNGEFQARNIELDPSGVSFDIYQFEFHPEHGAKGTGRKIDRIELSHLPGMDYNILNALGTYVMARKKVEDNQAQWDLERVKLSLKNFRGVKRRQEKIFDDGKIQIIEDFAKHAEGVRGTLKGYKKILQKNSLDKFSERKVIGVFEPRTNSTKTKAFQNEVREALSFADRVIIGQPGNQNKTHSADRLNIDELAEELNALGTEAYATNDIDKIVERLVNTTNDGDVIVIMSNGDFGGIYKKLIDALEKTGRTNLVKPL